MTKDNKTDYLIHLNTIHQELSNCIESEDMKRIKGYEADELVDPEELRWMKEEKIFNKELLEWSKRKEVGIDWELFLLRINLILQTLEKEMDRVCGGKDNEKDINKVYELSVKAIKEEI